MKKIVLGFVLGSVLTGVSFAAAGAYNLFPIVDWETDPVACYKRQGKAALIASLDEQGYLASDWQAFCLVSDGK